MRILFGNRQDSNWGGDKLKMNLFASALGLLGHKVDCGSPIDYFDPAFYDIIHAYNLNWPWTYHFSQLAKKYKKPFVVSTIHFDVERIPKQQQIEILDIAKALILFSEKEKKAIENFLAKPIEDVKCNYLVNGVSEDFKHERSWKDRDIDFLMVVNYLHPRKNIHSFAQACPNSKKVVVGLPYSESDNYYQQLLRFQNIEYITRRLSHKELNKYYNRAKVVCCVGTEDPYPQPVYESAMTGCNLVISNKTYVDLIGKWVKYCDPYNICNIESAMMQQLEQQHERCVMPSYITQAKKLIKIYEKIL